MFSIAHDVLYLPAKSGTAHRWGLGCACVLYGGLTPRVAHYPEVGREGTVIDPEGDARLTGRTSERNVLFELAGLASHSVCIWNASADWLQAVDKMRRAGLGRAGAISSPAAPLSGLHPKERQQGVQGDLRDLFGTPGMPGIGGLTCTAVRSFTFKRGPRKQQSFISCLSNSLLNNILRHFGCRGSLSPPRRRDVSRLARKRRAPRIA